MGLGGDNGLFAKHYVNGAVFKNIISLWRRRLKAMEFGGMEAAVAERCSERYYM